ncbi:ATP-binding protein [Streptomyces sp. ST2-7A]|uniref:ATP-binding protein n=1 Tax=Streptomyces sp. ST2-7A TaxID=2907214 RepID=UPI0035ABF539
METLHGWNVPPNMTERVQHVVAELCANAVLHGCRDGRDFHISLVLLPATGTVRVEVTDSRGDRLPDQRENPPPHGESGRGMALIAALADRWGAQPRTEGGKIVWAEIDPARPCPFSRPFDRDTDRGPTDHRSTPLSR